MMKTPKSLRLHIGIFGKTNVGKSSFLNAITNQNTSIVSDIAGTTTDVVEKSMELFPIGPVTFLDTAGIDDSTEIGELRLSKTFNIIPRCDIAIIVMDFNGISDYEINLIDKFKKYNIPFIVLINKYDINPISSTQYNKILEYTNNIIETSSINDKQIINKLIEGLVNIIPDEFINPKSILGDKVEPSDTVILVTPIDKEAPKGRLIMPQVQTIRDLLDNDCLAYVVQENRLEQAINNLKEKPKLVVTDSQAFRTVDKIVPKDIAITSFSILFARLKGDLNSFINGCKAIELLKPNDRVLILESCSHHTIEDDIAREKIPKLLKQKLGFDLDFDYKSGHDFPPISRYKLIIHCGACMTNRKEILSRILIANKKNIPITNYGIVISYCLGILDRALKIFNENAKKVEG